jgi:hypothetical protein
MSFCRRTAEGVGERCVRVAQVAGALPRKGTAVSHTTLHTIIHMIRQYTALRQDRGKGLKSPVSCPWTPWGRGRQDFNAVDG